MAEAGERGSPAGAFAIACGLQLAVPMLVGFYLHQILPDRFSSLVSFAHLWTGSIFAGLALSLLSGKKLLWPLLVYSLVTCGIIFVGLGLIAGMNSHSAGLEILLYPAWHAASIGVGVLIGLPSKRFKLLIPGLAIAILASLGVYESRREEVAAQRFAAMSANIQELLPKYLSEQALPALLDGDVKSVRWEQPLIRNSGGHPYYFNFLGQAGEVNVSTDGTLTYQRVTLLMPLEKPLVFQPAADKYRPIPTLESLRANGLNPALLGAIEHSSRYSQGTFFAGLAGYTSLEVTKDQIKLNFEVMIDPRTGKVSSKIVERLQPFARNPATKVQ